MGTISSALLPLCLSSSRDSCSREEWKRPESRDERKPQTLQCSSHPTHDLDCWPKIEACRRKQAAAQVCLLSTPHKDTPQASTGHLGLTRLDTSTRLSRCLAFSSTWRLAAIKCFFSLAQKTKEKSRSILHPRQPSPSFSFPEVYHSLSLPACTKQDVALHCLLLRGSPDAWCSVSLQTGMLSCYGMLVEGFRSLACGRVPTLLYSCSQGAVLSAAIGGCSPASRSSRSLGH